MNTTLVTGASGFLGWHIARMLLDKGHRVRCLVRPSSGLRDLEDAEPVAGDLREPATLKRAVAGCDYVFHAAADYRLWTPKPDEMHASNVDGTRNILLAAQQANVRRVVYTSTVGCIGMPKGAIGTEGTPVTYNEMKGLYKRSKFLAEQEAVRAARAGAPVVIVNPTAPVGDHDTKPTPTGKTVVDFVKGRLPAYLDTGLNIVDAADVAKGHWLALEKGVIGERYILGCENLTLRQIFDLLSKISGRAAPKHRVPYAVAYATGIVSTAWAKFTNETPIAPIDAVRMARRKMWVSHEKAARVLGYQPGPAEAALRKSVDWFRANGYC